MKIVSSLSDLQRTLNGTPFYASVGFFDGVHLGHQELLKQLSVRAKIHNCLSVVIALDRPYQEAIGTTVSNKPLLCSLQKKVDLLIKQPCDILYLLPFTRDVASMDAIPFLNPLIDSGLRGMVLGYDNRFGQRENELSLTEFDKLLSSTGLYVERIPQLYKEDIPLSSSEIRRKIKNGDFDTATALLGRPFSLIGEVTYGRQIGRTIQYPTANINPIDSRVIMPEVGIFITEVRVDDQTYPSMSYYGTSPTVSGNSITYRLEAYLFGVHTNLYGKQLEIAFRRKIREDRRFPSLEELKSQIQKDEEGTIEFFKEHPLLLGE